MKFKIVTSVVLVMLFGTMASTSNASAPSITGPTTVTQDYCVVIGSNNVPLRVRSAPNGRIIGKVKIGANIKAWDLVQDRYGNDWTKISYGRGYGWVSTQFISCG